jgi:hypothetical protein
LTEAYAPRYSLQRFLENWQVYLGYLLYLFAPFPLAAMMVLCVLLLVIALLIRSRPLIFCWCFMTIAPLPVCFIEPRGLNVWYIPFAGWAIFSATLLHAILQKLFPSASKLRELAAVLLFTTVGALLVVTHTWQRSYTFLGNAGNDQTIRRFALQFAELNPRLFPGSRTLFLNDPFASDDWTPVILLRLYFHDPALEIHRVKMPADQGAIASSSYDFVFDYRDDRLALVSSHRVNPEEVRALIANHP